MVRMSRWIQAERLCDLPGHSPLRRVAHTHAPPSRLASASPFSCYSFAQATRPVRDAQSFCESCEVQVGLGGTYTTGARPAAWYCQCL